MVALGLLAMQRSYSYMRFDFADKLNGQSDLLRELYNRYSDKIPNDGLQKLKEEVKAMKEVVEQIDFENEETEAGV